MSLASLLPYLIPAAVAALSPLFVRLFRKLGVDLDQSKVSAVLSKIINVIIKVEQTGKGKGLSKKQYAMQLLQKELTDVELQLINKYYGNLEAAVQWGFEQSSARDKKDKPVAEATSTNKDTETAAGIGF